jgi:hypothetical protein
LASMEMEEVGACSRDLPAAALQRHVQQQQEPFVRLAFSVEASLGVQNALGEQVWESASEEVVVGPGQDTVSFLKLVLDVDQDSGVIVQLTPLLTHIPGSAIGSCRQPCSLAAAGQEPVNVRVVGASLAASPHLVERGGACTGATAAKVTVQRLPLAPGADMTQWGHASHAATLGGGLPPVEESERGPHDHDEHHRCQQGQHQQVDGLLEELLLELEGTEPRLKGPTSASSPGRGGEEGERHSQIPADAAADSVVAAVAGKRKTTVLHPNGAADREATPAGASGKNVTGNTACDADDAIIDALLSQLLGEIEADACIA